MLCFICKTNGFCIYLPAQYILCFFVESTVLCINPKLDGVFRFQQVLIAGITYSSYQFLQESALLVEALEALPAAQRDAFLLHVEGGLAVGEIAALTSTPAETVKSRLRYAYKRLRASLGDPA